MSLKKIIMFFSIGVFCFQCFASETQSSINLPINQLIKTGINISEQGAVDKLSNKYPTINWSLLLNPLQNLLPDGANVLILTNYEDEQDVLASYHTTTLDYFWQLPTSARKNIDENLKDNQNLLFLSLDSQNPIEQKIIPFVIFHEFSHCFPQYSNYLINPNFKVDSDDELLADFNENNSDSAYKTYISEVYSDLLATMILLKMRADSQNELVKEDILSGIYYMKAIRTIGFTDVPHYTYKTIDTLLKDYDTVDGAKQLHQLTWLQLQTLSIQLMNSPTIYSKAEFIAMEKTVLTTIHEHSIKQIDDSNFETVADFYHQPSGNLLNSIIPSKYNNNPQLLPYLLDQLELHLSAKLTVQFIQ